MQQHGRRWRWFVSEATSTASRDLLSRGYVQRAGADLRRPVQRVRPRGHHYLQVREVAGYDHSVTLSKDQGSAHSVILVLNQADTSTLGNVSGDAIDKNLAIVLDGRVLSAPLVKAPITTSPLTLAFGSASEAKQTAADLSASATP